MKRLLIFLMVLTALSACRKNYANYIEDRNYVIENGDSPFSVTPLALSFPASGGTDEFHIICPGQWKLRRQNSVGPSGWCQVTPESGEGNATVTITVKPSTSLTQNYSVRLEFTWGENTLYAKIYQQTGELDDGQVLVNGKIWSTRNVGAPGTFVNSPDDMGLFYQFNRNVGYPFSDHPDGYDISYTASETGYILNAWTNNPCPDGWRVPTCEEIKAVAALGAGWVSKSQTGFKTDGVVLGIPADNISSVTKDNVSSMGALFLPTSGWITGDGLKDRDWLVAIRTATSLDKDFGGMYLRDAGGYEDIYGYGDGQKNRAAPVRCIKGNQDEPVPAPDPDPEPDPEVETGNIVYNGLMWAGRNVGSPGTFVSQRDWAGMYYQFNRKVGYPYADNPEGFVKDYVPTTTHTSIVDFAWDADKDPCPEGWRVPATYEFNQLKERGIAWVSKTQTGFGLDGIVVGVPSAQIASVTKNNLTSLGGIFIPQSGWLRPDGMMDRGWLVAIRTASYLYTAGSDPKCGLSVYDSSGYSDDGWGDGVFGLAAPVRCVKKVQ